MSQRNPNKASKSSLEDQYASSRPESSLTIREELSARQTKRAAKAVERRERSEALKEEVNTLIAT